MSWLCKLGLHKWKFISGTEGFDRYYSPNGLFECTRNNCDATERFDTK